MIGRFAGVAAAAAILVSAQAARADITIGGILSITGPTAAQGVGYKNAFDLMPKEMAGQKVTYIVRDDGGDPAVAVSIARKMIAEDHVDAFIGPATNPTLASVMPVAQEAHVPVVVMAPALFDVHKYTFAFDTAQPTTLMIKGVVDNMKAHGVKTVGYIGYSDGFGDQVLDGLKIGAAGSDITVVDDERFARTDTSVQPQVLKVLTHKPDVIMLGGSATPGALPSLALAQRNYKGQVYNNHGVVSPAYIQVGGQAVEGVIAPTGPLVVYDQLPDSNPVKKVATDFMTRYIAMFGPASRNAFAGYSYDAMLIIQAGVPTALKAGAPGTEAFRDGLRDGMEHVSNLVGTHGVYNMTPDNHNGMDERARVMVQVVNQSWKLMP
jgi:branched-chain amino acid transport system substrate-binding protein